MKSEVVKRLFVGLLTKSFESMRPSAINQLTEQLMNFEALKASCLDPYQWSSFKHPGTKSNIRRLTRKVNVHTDVLSRATFGLHHKEGGEFEVEIHLDPGKWPPLVVEAVMDTLHLHEFKMVKGGEIVMTRNSMLDTPKPQHFGAWT
jgi:hypothetical protein